ncbi:hypothetical protein B0H10DRAFT_2069270 [Mycena sp. CBHHK59/15]|nr:hypothetical protein B0H10DRAFT_2069270 [Mycena sp. CBHHK59/15]
MAPTGWKIHLERCWEEMMGAIDNPRGVHPNLAAVFEGAFAKIEKIGGDIGQTRGEGKICVHGPIVIQIPCI